MRVIRGANGRWYKVENNPKWAPHIHIAEGKLYGWCSRCPDKFRRARLRFGVKKDGFLKIFHRLHFLINVANRRNNQQLHRVATADRDWLSRVYRPA